jgi:hypothetical protein
MQSSRALRFPEPEPEPSDQDAQRGGSVLRATCYGSVLRDLAVQRRKRAVATEAARAALALVHPAPVNLLWAHAGKCLRASCLQCLHRLVYIVDYSDSEADSDSE